MSLVSQAVQSLCDGIRAGLWRDRLPSERLLGEHLQISRRTLRAALEELRRMGWISVSDRKRRSISSRIAKKSSRTTARVIGVLVPSDAKMLQPPMTRIMESLRDKLSKAGFKVEVHVRRFCFSSKPANALEKLIKEHPAAAWLILGSKEPMQRWFIKQKLPCLVLGSCAPTIPLPSLDVDYYAACRHAGTMLWRKGHRRIALVLPEDAFGGDVASEAGLRDSLHGLKGVELQLIRHQETTSSLLSRLDNILRMPHPPTAYLVAHVTPVLTLLTHLLRSGRRIPQDIAVIARDDAPCLHALSPRPAHYAMSRIPIARRAAVVLRQLAEEGTTAANAIRLMPKFVEGETL